MQPNPRGQIRTAGAQAAVAEAAHHIAVAIADIAAAVDAAVVEHIVVAEQMNTSQAAEGSQRQQDQKPKIRGHRASLCATETIQ